MIHTPLLLTDPSPCLRWLVFRHILGYPEDHNEVQELTRLRNKDPLVEEILILQEPDGSWKTNPLVGASLGTNQVSATAFALTRLGFLGFDCSHPAIEKGAQFLFSQQNPDGSWPLPAADQIDVDDAATSNEEEHLSTFPLQTALPLRGLSACGYASDPRCEKAYAWLLAQRLPDGAWPTGTAAGVYRYVGGYRRLAHSRWGCRSNTTAALICLVQHPQLRHSPEARRALDLLLGCELYEESSLGFEVARLVGAEQPRGFLTFFARHDLALTLSLCSRIGAPEEDQRLSKLLDFIRSRQGIYGLWEYASSPQVSRWVTFDILRSLVKLEQTDGWLSQEPYTPFQPYPRQDKRF